MFTFNKIQNRNYTSTSISKIKTESRALILYETDLSSSVGLRLNIYSRYYVKLSQDLKDQIIGHTLGDGSIYYSKTSINPCFNFTQSFKRFDYAWYSFNTMMCYCQSLPRINTSIRAGTKVTSIWYVTRSYPFLVDIHSLFYREVESSVGSLGLNLDSASRATMPAEKIKTSQIERNSIYVAKVTETKGFLVLTT